MKWRGDFSACATDPFSKSEGVSTPRCRGGSRSKCAVARECKIARWWVLELVARFDANDEAGQVPRSRRPRTDGLVCTSTAPVVGAVVLAVQPGHVIGARRTKPNVTASAGWRPREATAARR
jgi:hypothetical protein